MPTVNCQLLKHSNQIRLPLNFASIHSVERYRWKWERQRTIWLLPSRGEGLGLARGATNYRRLPDWSYISRWRRRFSYARPHINSQSDRDNQPRTSTNPQLKIGTSATIDRVASLERFKVASR